MHLVKKTIWAAALLVCFFCVSVRAQEVVEDSIVISKAVVLSVTSEEHMPIPGIGTPTTVQELSVQIIDGDEEGKTLTLRNDYIPLKKGKTFFIAHTTNALDATDRYSVYDVDRLPALLVIVILFILAVVIFGGVQGIRGLCALAGSLLLILYVLLPGILGGYSPVALSIGVASLIIIVGSYVTHGFNRTTTSAVLGMIVTILFTSGLAYAAVYFTQLSGFSNEEAVYLNYNTQGSINFVGLLFGGIMIGLLGVLYDAAIGQAVSVEELAKAGPSLSRSYIYKRAIRIGREHIGALVDTLAIAYVGASLPLLLLFYGSNQGVLLSINKEIFAAEIVRTMIGSIGLVLAVPITTLVSVAVLMRTRPAQTASIEQQEKDVERVGHMH